MGSYVAFKRSPVVAQAASREGPDELLPAGAVINCPVPPGSGHGGRLLCGPRSCGDDALRNWPVESPRQARSPKPSCTWQDAQRSHASAAASVD